MDLQALGVAVGASIVLSVIAVFGPAIGSGGVIAYLIEYAGVGVGGGLAYALANF